VDVPESITFDVSRQQIVAAVSNVIKNAYEAFSTGPDTFRAGTIDIFGRQINDDRVEVVIRDNGMGLNKEELAKVREFVPGGTSKKTHGTGFGLPIARRRIIDHGGDLGIDSEESKGTTVTITLPVETEGPNQS
jgi:two-component system sensor histidine kinase VicK